MSTVTGKALKMRLLAVLEELLLTYYLLTACRIGVSASYKSRVLEVGYLKTFVSVPLKLWFHSR